jgi:hypothetical protein
VTLDELDRWLDAYGRAWERKDTDAFTGCFADGALYAWGPWSEPLRGRDEIAARFVGAVATQQDIRFGHEPLAVTPDGRGIARWWVSTTDPATGDVGENEGIFLVTLGGDGLCSEFREWWNSRTLPSA